MIRKEKCLSQPTPYSPHNRIAPCNPSLSLALILLGVRVLGCFLQKGSSDGSAESRVSLLSQDREFFREAWVIEELLVEKVRW